MFQDFLNPFNIADESRLYCISFGCLAADVEIDILLARQKGNEDFGSFVDKQFISKKCFLTQLNESTGEDVQRSPRRTGGRSARTVIC